MLSIIDYDRRKLIFEWISIAVHLNAINTAGTIDNIGIKCQ